MLPHDPWQHHNAVKALYAKCVGPVCGEHHITRIELDILLFLANNTCYDTAKDIIEIRYLSKSQVSAAVSLLEQRGYLQKRYADDNRKTAHLKICSAASKIVHDGQRAQESFLAILLDGFSTEEVGMLRRSNKKILENIQMHLKEDKR